MKTKLLLSVLGCMLLASTLGQGISIELTFDAIDNAQIVYLDSVMIMNRSQGYDTMMLHNPNSSLSLSATLEIEPGDLLLYVGYSTLDPYVGIHEHIHMDKTFQLYQNYPNPVTVKTVIPLYIPSSGEVHFQITDMMGRTMLTETKYLERGDHSFIFQPGNEKFYILTASFNGKSQSIKIFSMAHVPYGMCSFTYLGKSTPYQQPKEIQVVQSDTSYESGILDSPETDKSYTFQFAYDIPCPGTDSVLYEGQWYHTVQIFSQCWFKENLNVGTMIPGSQDMTDNNTIEKYCANNWPGNCVTFGGLYQWGELMSYSTTPGAQGICPTGWHIPSDEEWKVLEGAADTQYPIGGAIWNGYFSFNGFDVAKNLKKTSGWNTGTACTDLVGFSDIPGGFRNENGFFQTGINSWQYTSTFYDGLNTWIHANVHDMNAMFRRETENFWGMSVRCVKDN